MTEQKQGDQLEPTYSSSMRIQYIALRTCQKRWTIGSSAERGSWISVLVARQDDDDVIVDISVTWLSFASNHHMNIHFDHEIYLSNPIFLFRKSIGPSKFLKISLKSFTHFRIPIGWLDWDYVYCIVYGRVRLLTTKRYSLVYDGNPYLMLSI